MALMFQRLARNFIKAGYFPTDEATLERIGNMLQLPASGACRMLDPCCGEGSALADIRHLLREKSAVAGNGDIEAEALGIEYDRERAWHAKRLLDRVIHSDVHDVVVKARSVGLLFLNPPYGYGVSDHARNYVEDAEKAERLERTFLRKTAPYLAYGGVLVYIIPHYALDDEIRNFLARNFKNLQVFMAPERQFKQCVVIGTRCRSGHASKADLDLLTKAQASEDGAPMLPETWMDEPWTIPAVQEQEFTFHAVRMDGEQLQAELRKFRNSLLWSGFNGYFSSVKSECRRPLRELTSWHLALSLAAGQVTGRIKSDDGRELLIKGDTYKRKSRSSTLETDEKGNVKETITMLDKFVPVICAIELTPDHRLGQIVKIA